MQKKLHIKRGDVVKVLAGDSRGEQGRILSIDKKKLRAVVEGVNMMSKHTKPNAKHPQGGIIKQESSIHISNLLVIEQKVAEVATKAKAAVAKKTKTVKAKKSGEETK